MGGSYLPSSRNPDATLLDALGCYLEAPSYYFTVLDKAETYYGAGMDDMRRENAVCGGLEVLWNITKRYIGPLRCRTMLFTPFLCVLLSVERTAFCYLLSSLLQT